MEKEKNILLEITYNESGDTEVITLKTDDSLVNDSVSKK